MSSKKTVEILYPGDARDTAPELLEIREHMPEPSRVAMCGYERFFTRKLVPPSVFSLDGSELITTETDEWEKILVNEGKTSFWAWRHIKTKLVIV